MAMVDLGTMTYGEIIEYVESLELEVRLLRKKTDNRKKLDPRDAERIRELYEKRSWSQQQLADAFDVNPATISRIVNDVYYPRVSA